MGAAAAASFGALVLPEVCAKREHGVVIATRQLLQLQGCPQVPAAESLTPSAAAHLGPHLCQCVCQVDRCGGLAHTPLAAGHCNDVAHIPQAPRPAIICCDGLGWLAGKLHLNAAHPGQLLQDKYKNAP